MPRNAACSRCALAKTCQTVCIWGTGPRDAEIMIIGEAPGALEDEEGRPFIGNAGDELDRALRIVGLPRAKVYITNPVKCRPPGNRDPEPGEMAQCWPYLAEEIQSLPNLKVIVAMGRFALHALTGKTGVKDERGRACTPAKHVRVGNAKIVATYHPAAYLNSGNKLQRAAILEDLRFAMGLAGLDKPPLPVHTKIVVYPDGSTERVIGTGPDRVTRPTKYTIAKAFRRLRRSSTIGVDVEWMGGKRLDDDVVHWPWTPGIEMLSVSFSARESEDSIFSVAMAWPAPGEKTNATHGVHKAMIQRLFDRTKRLVFHNAMADLIWLIYEGFKLEATDDSQFLAYLLNEEQRLNLDRLVQLVCGLEDWKVGVWHRRPLTRGGWLELLDYNANDTYATLVLIDGLMRMVAGRKPKERDNIRRAYRLLLIPAINPYVEMALTGVHVDLEGIRLRGRRRRAEREEALDRAAELAGVPRRLFEPMLSSPLKLKTWLRDSLGLDVPNTKDETLEAYRDQYPVLEQVAKGKHAQKATSTYYEPWERLVTRQGDESLHGVYRLDRSRTGRTTVSTEEGGSVHVTPREPEFREVIDVPRDGAYGRKLPIDLINADQSQVELRMTAWLAPEGTMRKLYQEDADLHKATAAFVKEFARSGLSLNEFWRRRQEFMATVTKQERQDAKGINFGYIFGMQEDKYVIVMRKDYKRIITPEQAHIEREGYFTLYDELNDYHERCADMVNRGITEIVMPSGRYRRNITEVTQMINTTIQTTANDLSIYTTSLVYQMLNREYGPVSGVGVKPRPCRLCGMIHDSLMIYAREDVSHEIGARVKDIMEHPAGIENLFRQEIPVPLKVDVEIKKTWAS